MPPDLFAFSYFSSRVSCLFSEQPELWSSYLPIPPSWDDRCTTIPRLWIDIGFSLTFCVDWPQTMILVISTSWELRLQMWISVPGFSRQVLTKKPYVPKNAPCKLLINKNKYNII
jgi:hypothetical protein